MSHVSIWQQSNRFFDSEQIIETRHSKSRAHFGEFLHGLWQVRWPFSDFDSRVNNKSSPHVNESCLNVVAIDLK